MTTARSPFASPLARTAAVLMLASAALLGGCARAPSYDGPKLTAWEAHQHARCVSLLQTLWGGERVRSTAAERGRGGLDYVWVNVDVDDDQDDIERRADHGTRHGGHCQFEHASDAVHVHSYALDGQAPVTSQHAGQLGYRFFTATTTAQAMAEQAGTAPR